MDRRDFIKVSTLGIAGVSTILSTKPSFAEIGSEPEFTKIKGDRTLGRTGFDENFHQGIDQLKKEGKMRFIGAANHGSRDPGQGESMDHCRNCAGFCEQSCPYGVPIQGLLNIAHGQLILA